MTVLAPKSGPRFESGSPVTVAWDPSDALVMGEPSVEVEDES